MKNDGRKKIRKIHRNITPWLNEDGTSKSTEELKKISSTWSANQWEDYLKSIEVPLREAYVLDPKHIEKRSQVDLETFYSSDISDYYHLKRKVIGGLYKLTPRQLQVVDMTFWQGMTQRAIAEKLGLGVSTVPNTLKRALVKLRRHMFDRYEGPESVRLVKSLLSNLFDKKVGECNESA